MTEQADDIKLFECCHCGGKVPIDEVENFGEDADFCKVCADVWKAEFAACEHDFGPYDGGEPGKICKNCHGFVPDEWAEE